MDHSVTVRDILLVLCALGGLAGVATGALMMFAGGMSSAPAAGNEATRQGCITGVVGLIVLASSIWGLL